MKNRYQKPTAAVTAIAEEDILRTSYGHQNSGAGDLAEWLEENV